MKTNVYIDGFNLYYGCLKGTSWRWLDLRKFCTALLPSGAVLNRIRYFTALVKTQQHCDPGTAQRQQIYLRALATLGIDVELGHYQSKPTRMFSHPLTNPPVKVPVLKTEEKGSDVNLASWLLLDGVNKDYEQALVVSNDADLATPVRMVRDDLKLPVWVFYPCTNPRRQKSGRLATVASHCRDVRKNSLQTSQFPEQLTDGQGTFSRPVRWK